MKNQFSELCSEYTADCVQIRQRLWQLVTCSYDRREVKNEPLVSLMNSGCSACYHVWKGLLRSCHPIPGEAALHTAGTGFIHYMGVFPVSFWCFNEGYFKYICFFIFNFSYMEFKHCWVCNNCVKFVMQYFFILLLLLLSAFAGYNPVYSNSFCVQKPLILSLTYYFSCLL